MEAVQAKLNTLTYEQCLVQDQSPLFTVLPGELRNEIYKWALVQYEDEQQKYEEDSYWYRPGFNGPRKSSSALLRTCRMVYVEAQRVIMREAEHAFWFDRGPDGRSGNRDCLMFFDKLTDKNVEELNSVRFFTQMYWIENQWNLSRIFSSAKFRPKLLTITFRYSDWWWWESNTPLRMSEQWLKNFNGPPGLKELRIEYETIGWKKHQLDPIVERNKKWKLRLQDSGHLSAENTEITEWKWTGPSKLGGGDWSHHGTGDTIEYVVVTDRWVFVESEMSEDDRNKVIMDEDSVFGDEDTDDEWGEAESDDNDEGDDDNDEDYSDDAGSENSEDSQTVEEE